MTADDIAVLDTDVASSLHRHRYLGRPLDASLADLIGEYRPVISVITLGDARYGIARAKWGPKRSDQLFAYYHRSFAILPVDETVADEYGRLRSLTEAAGRPIADNDLWIAATATATALPLITLN